MSQKFVSVQRIAEIAEHYAAKQLKDTPGLQIASMYRCIATVFREAGRPSKPLDEAFRQIMTGTTGAQFVDVTTDSKDGASS